MAVEYVTAANLQSFLTANDAFTTAKLDAAIAFASAWFDRLAQKPLGYFANAANFATVPMDVQLAVTKLTIEIIRRIDPVDGAAANVKAAQHPTVDPMVQAVADFYATDGAVQVAGAATVDPYLWDFSQLPLGTAEWETAERL